MIPAILVEANYRWRSAITNCILYISYGWYAFKGCVELIGRILCIGALWDLNILSPLSLARDGSWIGCWWQHLTSVPFQPYTLSTVSGGSGISILVNRVVFEGRLVSRLFLFSQLLSSDVIKAKIRFQCNSAARGALFSRLKVKFRDKNMFCLRTPKSLMILLIISL